MVTNDEMRDHHFKMLSPRWFNRWKERHQIRFSFETGRVLRVPIIKASVEVAVDSRPPSAIVDGSNVETSAPSREEIDTERQATLHGKAPAIQGLRRRNILLKMPLPYSCRIQRYEDKSVYLIPLIDFNANLDVLRGEEENNAGLQLVKAELSAEDPKQSCVGSKRLRNDEADAEAAKSISVSDRGRPTADGSSVSYVINPGIGVDPHPEVVKWLCIVKN